MTSSVQQSSEAGNGLVPVTVPRSRLPSSDTEPSSKVSNGMLERKRSLPSDSDSADNMPGPPSKVYLFARCVLNPGC